MLRMIDAKVAQALMDTGAQSASAIIKALDSRYLRSDSYTVLSLLEQFVSYPIQEGDDVLKAIDHLNHLLMLLSMAQFADAINPRLKGGFLLVKLPPSWKAWKDAKYGSTAARDQFFAWEDVVEAVRLEVSR